jgi:hypothetical protein
MNPTFAVVGHPNKGKSSIVATLAHDDSVAISAQSGTTQVSENLMSKMGDASYSLIDTPGFQRPTRVLAWLEAHAVSAELRQAAVRQFIEDPDCQKNFPDEVQLLTPIVQGAAILYVVDGSRPYGPEYETEMEILRWTGQPSMALINPIENESHIDAWTRALAQYFKVVKVFNPLLADFDKQLAILEVFSHLKEEWQPAVASIILAAKKNRRDQQIKSIAVLAKLLTDLCSYQVSQKVLSKEQALALRPIVEKQYFSSIKRAETEAFDELKIIFNYRHLDSEINDLALDDDLFDTEKWIIWGLNKKQLAVAATMAGATAGAILDAGLAGQSFLLGAIGGGLIGGGSAWFGADKLAEYKIRGLPIGGFEVRQGPIQNRNFPYVILARYLSAVRALGNRNHARRDSLQVEEGDLSAQLEGLPGSEKRALHSAFSRLSRQKSVADLDAILKPLFDSR